MRTIVMNIGTDEYKLATTLRVAYVLQGMHNHKSYLEVFKIVDTMPIEQQIGFLYAAYIVACDTEPMKKDEFVNMCLDNLNLTTIMDYIKQIIEGITGKIITDELPENTDTKN